MDKKLILLLGVLLIVGLLSGLVFWAYYSGKNNQDQTSVTDTPDNQTATSTKENYFSNIKVIFTDKVYPLDEYQSNPRLKKYVGKVQNIGSKNVSYLNIKVAYLDKNNKPIGENNVAVRQPLKPNYIEEFQFGGLDVPSDWAGKVDYEITEIKFEDGKEAIKYYPENYRRSPLERPPFQQILFFPNL